MKTIEEAARDYAIHEYWGVCEIVDCDGMICKSEEDFKAGVEFAQRWIPVEEELPKYDERVLVKIGDEVFIGTYYQDWNQWFDSKLFYSATGTSWRQIELK